MADPAPAEHGGAPSVTIDGETRVSYDLTIDDADQSFWLALGQSRNDGWQAEIDGGAISEPTTISGFANGWYVTPDGSGPITVGLTWTPQRLVWFAAGLSVLAILLCIVLIVRRRPTAAAFVGGEGVRLRFQPIGPEAVPSTSVRTQLLVTVGTTLTAAVIAPPPVALATGLAVLLALRWSLGATVVRLAAPALYALIAGYIIIRQGLERFPADFAWPVQFEPAHWPGMLVVLLVAVEVGLTVSRIRSRADKGHRGSRR